MIVSCSTKFHSFHLSEQLNKHDMLSTLYTTYHSQKNTFLNNFHKRKDQESIPLNKVQTVPILAPLIKKFPKSTFFLNQLFEDYVAYSINQRKDYKGFIGWSGMSLEAIRAANRNNKLTIVERGSTHILFQNEILKQEYKKQLGINFQIDNKVIKKELEEYEAADFISIPSIFVKKTFLDYGVPESKLFYNPYGVSKNFYKLTKNEKNEKFRILYLGNMSVRKGLIYLFKALEIINIPLDEFEVWFIGGIDQELESIYQKYVQINWKHWGYIEHHKLNEYLNQCDLAVFPTIEDGFGMVITQMLASGVPVITTTNSGGLDVIKDGVNGFLVPIRDPQSIADKLYELYTDNAKLEVMKNNASASALEHLSWDNYGERYANFLKKLF